MTFQPFQPRRRLEVTPPAKQALLAAFKATRALLRMSNGCWTAGVCLMNAPSSPGGAAVSVPPGAGAEESNRV